MNRLFCSEIKKETYDKTERIKVKRWQIVYLDDATVKAYPSVELKHTDDIKAFDGIGSQKIFFYEAFHRDGMGYQRSACWCHACVRGVRSKAFGPIEGCLSLEPMEYKIIRRTDPVWLNDKLIRTENLAREIFNKLKAGEVIAFDFNINKKLNKIFIGLVDTIDYPSHIKVIIFNDSNRNDYHRLPLVNNRIIHRNSLRYRFNYNPIVDNKICLSEDVFKTITENFYNGI
jgi:hypothetical protein